MRVYTIAILLFLIGGAAGAAERLHGIPDQCALCHGHFELTDGVPLVQAAPAALSDYCRECHPESGGPEHLTGQIPGAPLPAGIPLSDDGRLTCLSCHTAHGKPGGSLLRPPLAENPCGCCHDPLGTHAHVAAAGSAHGGFAAAGFRPARSLGSETRLCLSCHDGLIESDGAYHGELMQETVAGRGHPIGVLYAGAAAGTWDLAPPSEIAPLRLSGGRVGCLSCHDPYRAGGHSLAIENRQSRLCLRCHRKDLTR